MSEKCQRIFDEMSKLVPGADFSGIRKRTGGNLRFPIYINENLYNTGLEALDLSARSSNCLHRAGYRTVGQLVEAIDSREDLKKIRNCGAKSIDEIMEQLFCYQYCLLDSNRKIKYINKIIEYNAI